MQTYVVMGDVSKIDAQKSMQVFAVFRLQQVCAFVLYFYLYYSCEFIIIAFDDIQIILLPSLIM